MLESVKTKGKTLCFVCFAGVHTCWKYTSGARCECGCQPFLDVAYGL